MRTKKDSMYKKLRIGLFGEVYQHKWIFIWVLFIMSSIFITSFNDYSDYDFEDDHGFEVNVWGLIILVGCSFIVYSIVKFIERGDRVTPLILLLFLFNGITFNFNLTGVFMLILIIRLVAEIIFALLDNSGRPLQREET